MSNDRSQRNTELPIPFFLGLALILLALVLDRCGEDEPNIGIPRNDTRSNIPTWTLTEQEQGK